MAMRKSPKHEACPVARSLDLVGDRWSFMIVRDAFDGRCRFGEFLDELGIARNILADRLRKLVEAGILETLPAADGTAFQEYRLTGKGRELFPVLLALRQWGERHLFGKGERHSVMLEAGSGKAVRAMRPLASDGRPLAPEDVRIRKVTRVGG